MFEKVNQVINEKVKPQLKQHYGDIDLVSVEDGIVEVKLLGACSKSPSVKFVILDLLDNVLCKEFPEIKKVFLIHDICYQVLDTDTEA